MRLLFAAVFAALCAPARAGSHDCLFDGSCAARPALAADSPEPVYAETPEAAAAGRTLDRWSGVKKGASEGALFGFSGGLYPAVELVSDGFGRRMSRAYDGPRPGNGGGEVRYYGGIALGILLYIPALVLGGLGGLIGGAFGAAAPEAVDEWDAERALFD